MNYIVFKNKFINILKSIYFFYFDGFKNMKTGKILWLLIFLKLFIMFAIIKVLFFPNILKTQFETDEQRSNYILNQLVK